MIEGVITLSSSGSGKLYGRIVWEAESNGTAANTSEVTAKIQLHRPSGFTTTGTWKGKLNVGGKTASISYYGSIGSSWVTVKTLTVSVNHNADGAGTCYIYGKISGPSGTSMDGVSVSGSETITLEKIARYASIVSVATFTDEENPIVSYFNPAAEEVETLEVALSVDGVSDVVAYRSISKTDTRYVFMLSDTERNALRSATPNSNTLALYVLLRSSINDVLNVSVATTTMTVINADPKINPKVVDINSQTIALTGDNEILVAFHSIAQVIVDASAQKCAEIDDIKIEHGSVTLHGDGILNITNDPIKVMVTDSRGNATTYTATNTIIPYINPTSIIENSMPSAVGEMTLHVTGKVYSGSFGMVKNDFVVKYRFREGSNDYGKWTVFDTPVLNGFNFSADAHIDKLDYKKTHTFQVAVCDSLHPDGILSDEMPFVSAPIFDWGENDFNFNVPVSAKKLTGLVEPEDSSDAVNKWYVDTVTSKNLLKSGDKMSGHLSMGNNRIMGLGAPILDADAANKAYADTYAIYKVWANPAPDAALSAMTLSIDLSPYKCVAIKYRFSIKSGNIKTAFGCVGDNLALDGISTSGYVGVRVCQTSTDSVYIEDANYSGNVDNKQLYFIPLEIYGIKGVIDLTAPVEKSAICGTFLCGEVVAGQ